MTIHSIQATFGRGELTPKLHSRADIDHFKMGLQICENFTVMRQGGIRRRPGTQFISEVRDSSRQVRLIPFIFSATQAYVLELGDHYFRVFANGGRVAGVEVPTPWAAADIFALDYDQTNDILDITHKNYPPHRISRLGDTSWTVTPVEFRFGPYLPVNATATTITPSATGNAIPWLTQNVSAAGTVSASVEYRDASHNNVAWLAFDGDPGTAWGNSSGGQDWLAFEFPSPRVIDGYSVQCATGLYAGTLTTERAPKSWTFEGWNGSAYVTLDAQFAQSGWSDSETRYFRFLNNTPYRKYRLNCSSNNGGQGLLVAGLAFKESLATAPEITLAASATSGINNGAGFSPGDVGRVVGLLGSNAIYRTYVITSYASPTVVQAKLDDAPLAIATGTAQWRMGAWGTVPGWPARVCTYEGRKVYARTNTQPNGIWATKSGGYGSMLDFSVTVPTADDDAITFTLTDVNEIQWIAEGQDLLIGTAGAARIMGRDSANLPFSASNFRQSLASTYASQAVRPARVGTATIFASTFGKALREFVRSDNGVDYDTPDISLLSEHLFHSGIAGLSYAQEPDSIVWLPNGKGELIGLTYEKAQAMAGMHRHSLGGGGAVESCCTIPGADRNEVWLVVRRQINGPTRRYIERMAAPFEGANTPPSDAWHVDCGLQYRGPPATTASGLGHLEGQTVSILADGARETDQIVHDGNVTLAAGKPASSIIVGLSYRSRARTLPSPLSQGDGSGLGRRKKVVSASLDLFETGSLMVGRDGASAEEIALRHTTDTLGAAPPLVTGFRTARFASRWTDDGEVEILASGPLPATILSLTLSLAPEP